MVGAGIQKRGTVTEDTPGSGRKQLSIFILGKEKQGLSGSWLPNSEDLKEVGSVFLNCKENNQVLWRAHGAGQQWLWPADANSQVPV